jgi:hypothetical protein
MSNHSHTHTTESGAVVACYHECKSVLRTPSFWVLTTLTFPIEHLLWEAIMKMLHFH